VAVPSDATVTSLQRVVDPTVNVSVSAAPLGRCEVRVTDAPRVGLSVVAVIHQMTALPSVEPAEPPPRR
jgi:hypothetical protein